MGAELRPPRAELAATEGMDAWIDTYHAVRQLTRRETFVFLTDSAVGADPCRGPGAHHEPEGHRQDQDGGRDRPRPGHRGRAGGRA